MPSVVIDLIHDIYTNQNNPNTNWSGSFDVDISFPFGSGPSHGHLKFTIGEIPAEKTIVSATLDLFFDNFNTPTLPIQMVNNTEDWDSSTVTWNTKPSTGSNITNIGNPSNGAQSYDVTDYVKDNYNNNEDFGVSFYIASQDSVNARYKFERHTDADPAKRPKLTVVYSDTIPTPPILNYPVNINIDRSKDLKLQWSGAFHLESEIIWNDGSDHTVNIDGNVFEYTIPGNTINLGSVTWKVRHRYQEIGWSEYSEGSFIAVNKPPTPVITTTTLTTELPTITWTSVGQLAFNLKISDNEGVVINHTSFVSDLNYQLTQKLKDDTEYTIELSILDDSGLWSDYDTEVITSNFLKPDTPTFAIINMGDYADLVINNGLNTSYNEVLKLIDGEYIAIKQVAEDATVSVYELVSGKLETLKIRAYRDGGGFADSTTDTVTINVSDSQIVSEDLTIELNLSKNPQKNNSTVINATKNNFVGRTLPISIVGTIKERSPRWTFESFDNEDRVKLNSLIGVKALFRDRRGFIGWFVITSTGISELVNSYNLSITSVIEVNR